MDVVSTEDDGRDITCPVHGNGPYLTYHLCSQRVSARARKYPVIISWTWSFLVGQKHRAARARIAEEDVYLTKIATSPYLINSITCGKK